MSFKPVYKQINLFQRIKPYVIDCYICAQNIESEKYMILSKKRFSYDEEFYLSSMNPQFKADFMNHLYSTFDLFAAHSPESTLLADEPPEGYSSLLEAVKHPRWQDEETDII